MDEREARVALKERGFDVCEETNIGGDRVRRVDVTYCGLRLAVTIDELVDLAEFRIAWEQLKAKLAPKEE